MENAGAPDAISNVVELLVGIACLVAAASMCGRPSLRVWSMLLGVAGLAAMIHAAVSIVQR